MDYRAYIDSSVILRKLLRAEGAIADLTQWQLFSSQLLDVEVRRTLQRCHFEGALAADVFARRLQEWYAFRDAIDLVSISDGILQRAAEPFPTLIKTLDAIHLATALAWTRQTEEPIIVLTHDRQFGIAASACGYPVVP
jgi:predicted nucleic acid-binding protein